MSVNQLGDGVAANCGPPYLLSAKLNAPEVFRPTQSRRSGPSRQRMVFADMEMTTALLDIQKLGVDVETPRGKARILGHLDLTLAQGERLGIVGESGSGKSMMALAIMGLLPDAARTSGRLLFDGDDLLGRAGEKRLCTIRGRRIAMIFQEPMSALNPVQSIGASDRRGTTSSSGLGRRRRSCACQGPMEQGRSAAGSGLAGALSASALRRPAPAGDDRDRARLRAGSPDRRRADNRPRCDHPDRYSRSDHQAADEAGMALIMISHDLGVIARTTSRIAVMYAGRIVEEGPTRHVLQHMAHPYTAGLFAAMPQHAALERSARQEKSPAADHFGPGAQSLAADQRLRVRRALSPCPCRLPA